MLRDGEQWVFRLKSESVEGRGLVSALGRTLASSSREEGEHRHHLDTETGLNKDANLSFPKAFEIAIGVRWLSLGVTGSL